MLKPIPIPASSHIFAISYDDESMMLYVQFRGNGRTYQYSNVPGDVVAGFYQALSAGQYFDQNIKGNFDYELLKNNP
jgi:hypothetical protein